MVATLFGILVWRVVHHERSSVPVVLDARKPVRAPGFTMPRLDGGGDLSLSSFRGKGVVMNFWASWCAPCKEEMPVLQYTWRRYRSRGLVVLGVDVQSPLGDARSLARRLGVTYPLAHDGRGMLLERFSVAGLPQTLFVDRSGRLVGTRIQGGVDLAKHRADFARGIELALGR